MTRSSSRKYTDRIGVLERRLSHLQSVLADWHGKDPSYTKAEIAAIKWALDVIDANQISAITLIESGGKY